MRGGGFRSSGRGSDGNDALGGEFWGGLRGWGHVFGRGRSVLRGAMRLNRSVLLCVSLGIAACGGSQAASQEPAAPAAAAAEAAAPAEETAAASSESEADPAGATEESSGGSTLPGGRTPRDIVTAPDTIFMFSFNQSDVMQKAEKECEEKSKGDAKKNADCMAKEKAKIQVDGVALKEENGKWYFLKIRRKGQVLVNLSKIPVEFADETGNSVVLKPTGKDQGTAPKAVPDSITLEVPNDYQIVLTDPELGKLVYEAKIGIVGQ